MNKTELKGTKPALKSSAGKKQGVGRGGARPGSGRKKKFENVVSLNIDCPAELLDAMQRAGHANKTAYIVGLIAKDLQSENFGKRLNAAIEKISQTLNVE